MDVRSFLLGSAVMFLVMLFLWSRDAAKVHKEWVGICERYDQLVEKYKAFVAALEKKLDSRDDADWWKNI